MQGKPGPSNTRRGSEKKKVSLYNEVQVNIIILLEAMYDHLTHFECHDFVDIKVATFLLIFISAIKTRETILLLPPL